jgi:hypothetical protein
MRLICLAKMMGRRGLESHSNWVRVWDSGKAYTLSNEVWTGKNQVDAVFNKKLSKRVLLYGFIPILIPP